MGKIFSYLLLSQTGQLLTKLYLVKFQEEGKKYYKRGDFNEKQSEEYWKKHGKATVEVTKTRQDKLEGMIKVTY